MSNPWIIPAATLAVGAIGGFLAGHNTQSGTPEDNRETTSLIRSRSSDRGTAATTKSPGQSNRVRNTDEAYRLPGQSNRVQALIDLYANMTPEQLKAEAAKLEDLPMAERMLASFLLFSKWAETDALGAMAFSHEMGMAGNFVRPTILQSWASKDPESAARYYVENSREFAMMGIGGGRGMGGNPASIIAGEWAKLDPDAAMSWAQSLTGNDKSRAMAGVIGEIADKDLTKAWGLVPALDGDSKVRAYEDIARKWGAKDFDEIDRMITSLPADQQASVRAIALEGLAKTNSEAAFQKAIKLPAGQGQDEAIGSVFGSYARDRLSDALSWYGTANLSESSKVDLMGDLIPAYVSNNPAKARSYVSSLAAGPVRDEAVTSLLREDHTGTPRDNIALAETITDENSRNRTLFWTVGALQREDQAAASAYVQASPAFPQDVKDRVAAGQPIFGRGGPGGGGRRRWGN